MPISFQSYINTPLLPGQLNEILDLVKGKKIMTAQDVGQSPGLKIQCGVSFWGRRTVTLINETRLTNGSIETVELETVSLYALADKVLSAAAFSIINGGLTPRERLSGANMSCNLHFFYNTSNEGLSNTHFLTRFFLRIRDFVYSPIEGSWQSLTGLMKYFFIYNKAEFERLFPNGKDKNGTVVESHYSDDFPAGYRVSVDTLKKLATN